MESSHQQLVVEDYVKTDEDEQVPEVSVEAVVGTVISSDHFSPVEDRKLSKECTECHCKLSFTLRHVHRVYGTWYSFFWKTPDEYEVKCPNCRSQVRVTEVIPRWMKKSV